MNTWLVTFNLLLTHINRVSYAFDTYNTKLIRMCNKYSNYHLYTSLPPVHIRTQQLFVHLNYVIVI